MLAELKPEFSFDRGMLSIKVDSKKPLTSEQWDAIASLHPREFGFKNHALDDAGMDRLVALDPVSIGLNISSLTGKGFAKFGQMSSLVSLHTNHTITPTPEAQGAFSHHPSLESFSTVGPFGVEALDAPKLKTVVLEHGAASDAIVARMANHPAVETLKLGEWGGSTLTDAALPTLATLKKLTRLQIYLTALSYDGLRHLKDLPNLATLDLIEVELPEGDLEKLKADLPNVKITWKPMTPESRAKRQAWMEKAKRRGQILKRVNEKLKPLPRCWRSRRPSRHTIMRSLRASSVHCIGGLCSGTFGGIRRDAKKRFLFVPQKQCPRQRFIEHRQVI